MNLNFLIFKHCKKEWKHVRYKSNADLGNVQKLSSKEASKLRIQALADKLSCNKLTAREIVSKNRSILSLDSSDFDRNASFCQRYLRVSDVVECPQILSMNSSLLQHRYFSLLELGCKRVSACDVLKFPKILKKSQETLRKEGLLFSKQDLDCLSRYIDASERAAISSRLRHMYESGCSLKKIKEAMNAEFLVAKLGCSIGRAHQMFKRYPPLAVQSISNTDEILNVLLAKCGFTATKIFQNLNLLSMHHESVQAFLCQVPSMLGVNTEYILQKQPLLLKKPIQSMQELESVLKHFRISDDQLRCCPKILVFAPCTLEERLSVLCHSRDFTLMKSFKKFLWLVYYFNNLESRLRLLKEQNLPMSVNSFLVSKNCFDKHLRLSDCKSRVKDICSYLSNFFNLGEKEISAMLKEYPSSCNSSLLNCQRVIEFLSEAGVTKKQILRGIGVIFYDVDVVEAYFKELRNHPECQTFDEWMMHYNLIQLLIYNIEVDTGFQGSRLFNVNGRIEEEELMVNYSSN